MVPFRLTALFTTTPAFGTVAAVPATLACTAVGRRIFCAFCCGCTGAGVTEACFIVTLDTVGSWTTDVPWGKALWRAMVAPGRSRPLASALASCTSAEAWGGRNPWLVPGVQMRVALFVAPETGCRAKTVPVWPLLGNTSDLPLNI